MKRQPVIFIGHGSPMHAIQKDQFSKTLNRLGQEIGKPKAIICISAHWLTQGIWLTAMDQPRTIHDFRGFPDELFAINYPAPGSPRTAKLVKELIKEPRIELDLDSWGLDHGAWAVLRHLYPQADIPVIQLSIDIKQPGPFYLDLGRKLASLRELGILILGSGNIVHNLRRIEWDVNAAPYDWNVNFDQTVKLKTEQNDFDSIARHWKDFPGAQLSVPTLDHWYPYLCTLGAAQDDQVRWEYEGLELGSMSMRSASFGIS